MPRLRHYVPSIERSPVQQKLLMPDADTNVSAVNVDDDGPPMAQITSKDHNNEMVRDMACLETFIIGFIAFYV